MHMEMMMKGENVWTCALVLVALCTAATAQGHSPGPVIPLGRRSVECRLPEFPACYGIRHFCPPYCPASCFLDCGLCRPVCACIRPGAVCQDPRFVGGDGVAFYFHGKQNHDFCLVSDRNLHINAHFIGRRNLGRKRDFTWVQSLGILFDGHKLFVGAKKTAAWDDASDRLELAFDGQPIALPSSEGATWKSHAAPGVSVARTRAANGVTVEAEGKFAINAMVVPITEEESRVHKYNIPADDCFAHLDLGFKFHGLSEGVDGVLGQTYRANYTSRVKMSVAMPVLGGDREFSSSSLFATDCAASRFTGAAAAGDSGAGVNKHASLHCVGGAGGRGGVFCKN